MNVEQVNSHLLRNDYIASEEVATSLYLSLELGKPLLIEGPAGVGKTEVAKVLSKILDTNLIRLQCYEGLDVHHAIYEWNYQRQILHLKMMEEESLSRAEREATIFSKDFLMARPLLQAITSEKSPVLLIDEVDRADEEFESFLLEILSDWQITIPEIGSVKATTIPYVVLTGNRTRELSEALRRRCLYLWIDYPVFDKELAIVMKKVPQVNEVLGTQICKFLEELRKLKLEKTPGIAESLDWAQALTKMHFDHLDKKVVERTLGVILKDWQDIRTVTDSLSELFEKTGIVSRIG